MKSFSLVATALSLAAAVSGRSTHHVESKTALEVFERLSGGVPQGWSRVSSPQPDKRLQFKIAVTQPNQALFEQSLMEISTPDHPRYGQHLSKSELKRMLKPDSESTEAIIGWLSSSGIADSDIDENGEWINFVATVSQAEAMMDTKFDVYKSTVTEQLEKIRTTQYSLPKELHRHVDLIQPTTRFGQVRPQFSTVRDKKVVGKAGNFINSNVAASCNSTITPQCLKDLYNVNGYEANGTNTGFMGISGYLEEYARYADLEQFTAEYATWAQGKNFSWVNVNGGLDDQNSQNDSIEANLDIQYTMSIGNGVPQTFFSTGGRGILVPDLDQPTAADNNNEPYLDFFSYLTNLEDGELPHTLSTSYGEDEQSIPESYTTQVCNMIGQLGSRGVTVIFSSGDTGVGSACQTNDGKNTTRFLPIFPAACPYVTSVGGVHLIPETAIDFSSGGFSDRFPRPDYQSAAVEKYLGILGDQWDGLYNKTGRGFPDLAAQANQFRVVDKGQETLVGGTSAAAPTVAGIIAQLNAAKLAAGQSPMGFINPWLYSTGVNAANDVTLGGSTGCTGTDIYSGLPAPLVPYASWNATEGWDPVTGLGTPNLGKWIDLAVNNGSAAYKTRQIKKKAVKLLA